MKGKKHKWLGPIQFTFSPAAGCCQGNSGLWGCEEETVLKEEALSFQQVITEAVAHFRAVAGTLQVRLLGPHGPCAR